MGKRKEGKDPNAPKRPMYASLLYTSHIYRFSSLSLSIQMYMKWFETSTSIHNMCTSCIVTVRIDSRCFCACLVCRTAFFHYSNEHRDRVRKAHPDYKIGDVAKDLSRQYLSRPLLPPPSPIAPLHPTTSTLLCIIFLCKYYIFPKLIVLSNDPCDVLKMASSACRLHIVIAFI